MLLALPLNVNKVDASVLCRGGAGNSDKVFDTVHTGYGPLSGRAFVVPISLTLVFAVIAGATIWIPGRVSRWATVACFITTGVYLAMVQHTLRNPGCTVAIHRLGDPSTRVATALLTYTWILRPLTLVPSTPSGYTEPVKPNEF